MAEYKKVLIEWKDEPGERYLATVAIDQDWFDGEDDDEIFFYFGNKKEYKKALGSNDGFDFRILQEVK